MLTSRRAKHKLDLKAPVRSDRWALSLGEQRSRTVCTSFSHTRHSGQGLAGREGHRLGCQPVRLLETLCTCTCGDTGLLREGEGRQWLVGGSFHPPPGVLPLSCLSPFQFPLHPCPLDTLSLRTRAGLAGTEGPPSAAGSQLLILFQQRTRMFIWHWDLWITECVCGKPAGSGPGGLLSPTGQPGWREAETGRE